MKNKLLVLSLGALCVSQIWESNHASAVVSGEKNPYVSKALSIKGQKTNSWNLGQYKDSLRTVMCTSEINKMMDMMNLNIKRRWILTEKIIC